MLSQKLQNFIKHELSSGLQDSLQKLKLTSPHPWEEQKMYSSHPWGRRAHRKQPFLFYVVMFGLQLCTCKVRYIMVENVPFLLDAFAPQMDEFLEKLCVSATAQVKIW